MVLDIIKNRWSPVSSMNEQPWMFILTTRDEPEYFNKVADLLFDGNQPWARNAYALIISLARMNHSYKERPNRYAFHDTGMAVSNMLLQALSMDVYVHQMGGFSVDKAKLLFNLDADIEPVAVMAVGYMGDGAGLSEDLILRDKKRKPRKSLSEYAFRNKIGNPAF
jgi:nitroreductase